MPRAGVGRRDESSRSEEGVAVTMAGVGGQRDESALRTAQRERSG